MTGTRYGLPASRRLRTPAEFAKTLKSLSRSRDDLFSVSAVANPYRFGRLGVVVSRKVSTRAVVRNRVKRQIRESFRRTQASLAGLDLVVMANPPTATAPADAMRSSLEKLWERVVELCRKS